MASKIVYLIVLILLFVGGVFGYTYYKSQQTQAGRIKILSSPTAGIFIDNVSVGRTPYEGRIDIGEHEIKLIPEGIATDTVSWQSNVNILNGTLTYINRELGSSEVTSAGEMFTVTDKEFETTDRNNGEVYVLTEPNGAIVYLNNDEKGVAPLVLRDVPKGDHELSVYLPGFFRRTHKVNVEAGKQTRATFTLSVDQTKQSLDEVIEQRDERIASEEAEKAEEEEEFQQDSEDEQEERIVIVIDETSTGWLRVRASAGVGSEEVGRVDPGDEFEVLDEQSGWYQIEYDGRNTGWVSSQFTSIVE